MRVIARRSESVWLLSEDQADPPGRVRVLDLLIGRLYASHPTDEVMAHGDWAAVEASEAPDVEELLGGVEMMPDEQVSPVVAGAGTFG